MKIGKGKYIQEVSKMVAAGAISVGPCSFDSVRWMQMRGLPAPLLDLFKNHAPLTEIWAGAGTIYAIADIEKWNEDFPEALASGLLIIGSAANGDHIAIRLEDGG